MNKRRWGQWILLAVVCLSFSIGESYAQKNDFANLRRYSKENAALPQATKKDKRVIFMGNSITEGWVRTHPDFFQIKWLHWPWNQWADFLSILVTVPGRCD